MKRLDQNRTLVLFLTGSILVLLVGIIRIVLDLSHGFVQGPISFALGFMYTAYGVLAIQVEMNYRKNHITFPSAYIFTGLMMSLVLLVFSILWFSVPEILFFALAFLSYLGSFISNKIYFS
ncbi:MAG: hypothetical protein ACOYL6_10585 [Bacteriovoracaceae bacterium]